jgi:hypothetical protein
MKQLKRHHQVITSTIEFSQLQDLTCKREKATLKNEKWKIISERKCFILWLVYLRRPTLCKSIFIRKKKERKKEIHLMMQQLCTPHLHKIQI